MLSIFNTVLTNQFSVGIYLACLLCAGLCRDQGLSGTEKEVRRRGL